MTPKNKISHNYVFSLTTISYAVSILISETTRDEMKVLLNVIMAVCLMVLGFVIALIFVTREYGVPKEATPFKNLLENYGLNLLGDSLAGIMALVTLLVVMASLAQQLQQSKQSVKDMKAQNNLNEQIANANLKLGLYDKRLSVYTSMREICQRLSINGTVHVEEARLVFTAVDAAKFIFPSDVNTYLNEIGGMADEIVRLQFRMDSLNHQATLRALTAAEMTEHDTWNDRQSDVEDELFAALSYTRIDEVFGPHLTIPDRVESAA